MAPSGNGKRKYVGRKDTGRLGRLVRILEADGFSVTPPTGKSAAAGGTAGSSGRAAKAPWQPQMKDGDWLCPSCGFHNFASRKLCRDCSGKPPVAGQAAPGGQQVPQKNEQKQGKFEEQLASLLESNPAKKALLSKDLLGQLLVPPKPVQKKVSKQERVRKAGAAAEEARIALNKAERAEEKAREALTAAQEATVDARARKEAADQEIVAAAAAEEEEKEAEKSEEAMDADPTGAAASPPPVPAEVKEAIAKLSDQELPKDAVELRNWLGSIAASLTSTVEKAFLDVHAAAGRAAASNGKAAFAPY